jgi:DNA polymerase-1|tara:strand:+ start:130 stop:1083 length:954 start_codon:yes stop_codon:yes gene_type:complete
MKRLLIIDGQNMFIRNYVMSPQLDINGNPIGGLTGFMRSLQKEVRRAKPDRVAICWEGPGGSQKRREKNKNYKLGRKAPRLNREYTFATPEEERENKYSQLVKLTEYLDNLPVLQLSIENVEADDIIAWLCHCNQYSDWQKLIISNDKDFIQLCDDKTVLVRPGKNEEVLNKNSVLEQYNIHPRNFAWARAITGDKSDNLEGVKGLGLATVAKRFSFLSENQDYTLKDIMTHAKNNNSKIKAYQNVLDSEEIIASNYEIMQLYTSTISSQGANKLKYAIKNDGVDLNRSEIRKMLLKDGIGTLNIDDLMLMLNSHKK